MITLPDTLDRSINLSTVKKKIYIYMYIKSTPGLLHFINDMGSKQSQGSQ